MGKFIVGTILAVISAVLCAFGSYMLISAISATNVGEAIFGIIAIPIAIISYVLQFITCVASETLLWINYANRGRARIASMIIAVITIVLMVASISLFVYALVHPETWVTQ